MKKLFLIIAFSLIIINPCNAGVMSWLAYSEASSANNQASAANSAARSNSQRLDILEQKVDKILEILNSKK